MFKAVLSRADYVAGLLVACLLVGWVAHGLIVRPADAPFITIYKQWRVVCPEPSAAKADCSLSQDVTDPKTNAIVVRFVMSGDPSAPKIDIAAPFNVLLPPALGLSLNAGAMQAVPYHTCNGFGCIATVTDRKTYDAVLAASKIRVYYESLDAKVSGWELSMTGYGQAVAALNSAEAKRHSWLRRVLL